MGGGGAGPLSAGLDGRTVAYAGLGAMRAGLGAMRGFAEEEAWLPAGDTCDMTGDVWLTAGGLAILSPLRRASRLARRDPDGAIGAGAEVTWPKRSRSALTDCTCSSPSPSASAVAVSRFTEGAVRTRSGAGGLFTTGRGAGGLVDAVVEATVRGAGFGGGGTLGATGGGVRVTGYDMGQLDLARLARLTGPATSGLGTCATSGLAITATGGAAETAGLAAAGCCGAGSRAGFGAMTGALREWMWPCARVSNFERKLAIEMWCSSSLSLSRPRSSTMAGRPGEPEVCEVGCGRDAGTAPSLCVSRGCGCAVCSLMAAGIGWSKGGMGDGEDGIAGGVMERPCERSTTPSSSSSGATPQSGEPPSPHFQLRTAHRPSFLANNNI